MAYYIIYPTTVTSKDDHTKAGLAQSPVVGRYLLEEPVDVDLFLRDIVPYLPEGASLFVAVDRNLMVLDDDLLAEIKRRMAAKRKKE